MASINDKHIYCLKPTKSMVLQLLAIAVHFSVYDKFHLTKAFLRDKTFRGNFCQQQNIGHN